MNNWQLSPNVSGVNPIGKYFNIINNNEELPENYKYEGILDNQYKFRNRKGILSSYDIHNNAVMYKLANQQQFIIPEHEEYVTDTSQDSQYNPDGPFLPHGLLDDDFNGGKTKKTRKTILRKSKRTRKNKRTRKTMLRKSKRIRK